MSQHPDSSAHSEYYAARAIEERRLAMASADAKVRAIHLQMAGRYDELSRTGAQEPPHVIGNRERA
jgi:hypothetical protein